jgi:3-methylcrotonyl-CoA carboxylase beta subunit
MTRLTTLIDRSSEVLLANDAHNRALVQELSAKIAVASRGCHVARGKLLPRDRVHRLLDPGSPFLEVGALAAPGLQGGEASDAGLLAG